jgi:hypothetical protein
VNGVQDLAKRRSGHQNTSEACLMIDILYVATTLVFFALMIAYVGTCDRLGRKADVDRATKEQP